MKRKMDRITFPSDRPSGTREDGGGERAYIHRAEEGGRRC